MARRKGRPGAYLATDDTSGFTEYRDKLSIDYWGNLTRYGLERNLQEISSPLGDPYPVPIYRGPDYEQTNACDFETTPLFVGKTGIAFKQNSAYAQFINLDPAIPDMSVGCTFIVRPDLPIAFIATEDHTPITTESGLFLVIA